MVVRAEREILQNELMIAFYKKMGAENAEAGVKAKYLMKADEIQKSLDFNVKFSEFISEQK
jgi:hypothetical protein